MNNNEIQQKITELEAELAKERNTVAATEAELAELRRQLAGSQDLGETVVPMGG